MSDTTTYTLWCIADGDNTVFSVTVLSSISIDELKNKIKEAKSNFLQRVDASDLTLSKVRYF
jgi:hypothetical protein